MKNKQEKEEEGKTRFVTRRRFAELCSIEGVDMPMSSVHTDIQRIKIKKYGIITNRRQYHLLPCWHSYNRR